MKREKFLGTQRLRKRMKWGSQSGKNKKCQSGDMTAAAKYKASLRHTGLRGAFFMLFAYRGDFDSLYPVY